MARYSIPALAETQMSITGGEGLDGVTQGDGSHLVGEFITFNTMSFETLDIKDGGQDIDFDDNDNNQRIDGAQSFNGTNYSHNTQIEAEYLITLRDNATGETYDAVAVNLVDSTPAYATVEGLAFVAELPPNGVALEVISASEGPGSMGQPAIEEAEFVVCFARGTGIATPAGRRRIEQLQVGDDVLTRNNGPQQIRWIGRRRIGSDRLRSNPRLRPVRIRAGALGNGLPMRDLLVSRQHRMLVHSRIAGRMFGAPEVLLPAIKLVELPGIDVEESAESVEYFHLLFDRHEIIHAEGAPTESLFTGPEALKAMSPEAREELFTIFPELEAPGHAPQPARYIPPGKQQRRFIARHIENNKPLLSEA